DSIADGSRTVRELVGGAAVGDAGPAGSRSGGGFLARIEPERQTVFDGEIRGCQRKLNQEQGSDTEQFHAIRCGVRFSFLSSAVQLARIKKRTRPAGPGLGGKAERVAFKRNAADEVLQPCFSPPVRCPVPVLKTLGN